MDYAIKNFFVMRRNPYNPVHGASCIEALLASYATALHTLSRYPALLEEPSFRQRCRQILVDLRDIFQQIAPLIRTQASFSPNHFGLGVLLITATICNTLCTSFVALAQMNLLPFDEDLSLLSLLDLLTEALEGARFEEGRQALSDFRATHAVAAPPAGPQTAGAPHSPAASELTSTDDAQGKTGSDDNLEVGAFSALGSDIAVALVPVLQLEPMGHIRIQSKGAHEAHELPTMPLTRNNIGAHLEASPGSASHPGSQLAADIRDTHSGGRGADVDDDGTSATVHV